MWACDSGNTTIVQDLIKYGAKVELCDSEGKTALMYACLAGNSNVAKILFENFADINDLSKVNNTNGKTFLMQLCEFDMASNLVNWLLSKYVDKNNEEGLRELVNASDFQGATALMIASNSGFSYLVEILLKNGADVNKEDLRGNTALHIACEQSGTIKTINILLDNGADINKRNRNGNTALHKTCCNNLEESTNLLIKRGADISILDQQANNVIHIACIYESVDVMPILLEQNIDINTKNNAGKTPLIIASSKENEESV